MCNQQAKNGKFEDYEFPASWTAKDQIDWVNGMLADVTSVASVELCLDGEGDLCARVWFRKPGA